MQLRLVWIVLAVCSLHALALWGLAHGLSQPVAPESPPAAVLYAQEIRVERASAQPVSAQAHAKTQARRTDTAQIASASARTRADAATEANARRSPSEPARPTALATAALATAAPALPAPPPAKAALALPDKPADSLAAALSTATPSAPDARKRMENPGDGLQAAAGQFAQAEASGANAQQVNAQETNAEQTKLPAAVVRSAAPERSAAVVVSPSTPAYLQNPPPPWPEGSRERGESGRVLLSVYVDAQGQVERLKVQRGTGFTALDASALQTVRSWRFVAGTRDGKPQAMWVAVPVDFVLRRQ